MQFKDIVLLLAAAGSAVTALPAPEAEAQDAPVRRAEQAEQGEQAKQGKQGDQFINPALNGIYPGSNLGFQNLQSWQQDPRFDPRFQDPRLFQLNGINNGIPPFFGNNFKRDVEAEYNPLARRAEQAEAAKQGKQFLPFGGNQGFGNNGFGNNGFGTNGIVAGGGGAGGVILGGNNGFGNNGWGNNGFPWNNRLNQFNRFPQRFDNDGFDNPFSLFD